MYKLRSWARNSEPAKNTPERRIKLLAAVLIRIHRRSSPANRVAKRVVAVGVRNRARRLCQLPNRTTGIVPDE